MTTNEFIPVVFNDGEPLDPTKLNNLVKNVNNVITEVLMASGIFGDNVIVSAGTNVSVKKRDKSSKIGLRLSPNSDATC